LGVYLFSLLSATNLHFFLGVFLHFITGADSEEDDEDDPDIIGKMLRKIHNRELVSEHIVHTSNLTETIYKNKLAVHSMLDKTIALYGEIKEIDYDKRRKMPYITLGSGHYFSSSSVCDRYACYFSDPKQIDTLQELQVGERLIVCGIFLENDQELPSSYILSQSYILDMRGG